MATSAIPTPEADAAFRTALIIEDHPLFGDALAMTLQSVSLGLAAFLVVRGEISAGSIIAFSQFNDDLKPGDLGVICSFGAGYSAGSVIVRKVG